ncbi:Lrp/AsnC family transcriptional regulator [Fulvivirga sp. M361]|uniref:Lrp/AsnC family transcriptional regulator n=1 Tax=Fulvivirga sp. M361 TaxID=2594266 RepID=UPI001179DCE2|nr:Lrp/AsnC family transcriptional regulator [Fulvivirga sp. M361]TRX59062.1 Lrp/AsnC family transcriptional regulator [Fulvivirga sp. M361]
MIDALDEGILDVLQKNSRLSFAEIGRKIGLSPSAVRERVQKLEEMDVIKGYGIEINHRLLGYDIEAFISVKTFHGRLKPFLEVLKTYPALRKAYRITGGQNVHLEVVVKDRLQLQELIDQIMQYGDTSTQLILSEVMPDERTKYSQ